MADIRIKDLPETSDVSAEDYVAVDNAGDGTRKFTLRQLVASVGDSEFVVNVNASGEADKTLSEIMAAITNGYVPVVFYDDGYYQLAETTETAVTFTKCSGPSEMSEISIMEGSTSIETNTLTSDNVANNSDVAGDYVSDALDGLLYSVTNLSEDISDVQFSVEDHENAISSLDTRVTALESGGGGGGTGLTQTEKNLILALFEKAAYAEDDAGTAYDQLESLWVSSTKTITYNLSNVISSHTETSIESGQMYYTDLAVPNGYSINLVTVTMGGEDITSTAYRSGTITIPSVMGNIVITASAVLAAQSITAVYTQSGTVYDADSLDSLKADLVVTANYAGGTSETVPASNYTLSGTLVEGTSTITVSYAGLTDTFTVTVTHAILPLYNWDFTQSLTDTVAGVTATLTGCTRDSSGVNFTAINQAIMLTLNKTSIADKTFVFEIPTYTGDDSGSYHARLFCSDSADTMTDSGAAGFVYRHGMGWTVYSGSAWGTSYSSTDYPINFFNAKKLKIYISSELQLTVSYADINSDTFITLGTIATAFGSDYASGYWVVGGSRNNNLKNCVFSKITVYEGEV